MDVLKITLAAARVNAGLTQEDVSKALGVTKQSVVNWEKGSSEPKISQGYALSRLYNIPIDNLIFLETKSN